jgi:hypothetical protein
MPSDNGYGFVVVLEDGAWASSGHLTCAEAWAVADDQLCKPFGAYVTLSEQRVTREARLACNECGKDLYYCQSTGWYHHVDPDQECYTVGAEEFNYYETESSS